MYKLLTSLLISATICANAQISVFPQGSSVSKNKWPDGLWEKFKNTTTVFIFPETFEKEVYEKILKESWKVTPYLIISGENISYDEMAKKGFSYGFLRLTEMTITSGNSSSTYIYTSFEIGLFNSNEVIKKINRIPYTKRDERIKLLLSSEYRDVGLFNLYQDNEFATALKKVYKPMDNPFSKNDNYARLGKMAELAYSKNTFHNYQPGLLKNYFQCLSDLIEEKNIITSGEKFTLPELAELASKALYIPEYVNLNVKKNFNPLTQSTSFSQVERTSEEIKKLYSNYSFEYEIITMNDLNNKILEGEYFYYLRCASLSIYSKELVLEVVNGKNGKVVYKSSYKQDEINASNLKAIDSEIKALNKK